MCCAHENSSSKWMYVCSCTVIKIGSTKLNNHRCCQSALITLSDPATNAPLFLPKVSAI